MGNGPQGYPEFFLWGHYDAHVSQIRQAATAAAACISELCFPFVAYVEAEELQSIEGFDDALVVELQERAIEGLEARQRESEDKRKALGVSDDLAEVEGLIPEMLVALGEQEIKSLEDFAGLATDELTAAEDGFLRSFELGEDEASRMIIEARRKAGWIPDEDPEEIVAESVEAAEPAEGEEEVDPQVALLEKASTAERGRNLENAPADL